MPKKFFRRYLPGPGRLRKNRQLHFALGEVLHDPNLWHLNRRSVSGAFAVGLFVAWIPLPVQMVTAGLLALFWRINLPLSVVLVWITNPVTIGPMFWSAWRLGDAILGHERAPNEFAFTFHWFTTELAQVWQPLLLGCFILGLASAGIGYLVSRLFWRYHVIRTLLQRRRSRRGGEQHGEP